MCDQQHDEPQPMDTQHIQRLPYSPERYRGRRWLTRRVPIGTTAIGGLEPVRVQSMTTTLTQDVEATVRQSLALAEAGSELVRITAPHMRAAQALGPIRKALRAAGVNVPLVADIHFLPQAAMEAAKHVEKVRINPGNFADRKKFAQRSYTDVEYEEELERLYKAFTPLVLRCKENGCAMRIGTNHGSLSDRILNRYGDTPMGMVASALEFIDIAQSHGYQDIILSMKASNPKIMLQAYRLAAALMQERGLNYPLHLGVTEAGAGEDARIKSAIGIGTLLEEGLGDTIRVSLTEDPVAELPVALALAKRAMALWEPAGPATQTFAPLPADLPSPYVYERRPVAPLQLGPSLDVSSEATPRVLLDLRHAQPCAELKALHTDAHPIEGVLLELEQAAQWGPWLQDTLPHVFWALALPGATTPETFELPTTGPQHTLLCLSPSHLKALPDWLAWGAALPTVRFALDASPEGLQPHLEHLQSTRPDKLLYTRTQYDSSQSHALGSLRQLADWLRAHRLQSPLWLRLGSGLIPSLSPHMQLLEASILAGGLLCEGLGDLISLELPRTAPATAHSLTYNLLQGARARSSKTEFVACPSCGRTLFDLETTTQKIQARTGHLRGLTIAVMGCIVNGPGEMADAHFGYVGGAPGKVNLYKGKECLKVGVPEAEAVEALVDLIKACDAWVEPPQETRIHN